VIVLIIALELYFVGVSTQKRTVIFEGKMPNLVGKFSIASRVPNEDLKAPLEISGFVDVD
jgi:hypothetical protein